MRTKWLQECGRHAATAAGVGVCVSIGAPEQAYDWDCELLIRLERWDGSRRAELLLVDLPDLRYTEARGPRSGEPHFVNSPSVESVVAAVRELTTAVLAP